MTYDEGDQCPDHACEGTLRREEVVGCSCHISPSESGASVDAGLICDDCGEDPYAAAKGGA